MPRMFNRHFSRKRLKDPRRPASICGRPAHEVVAERRNEAPAAASPTHPPSEASTPASVVEAGAGNRDAP